MMAAERVMNVVMANAYISRKRLTKDVYEVVVGDGVFAEVIIWSDGYELRAVSGVELTAEIERLAEEFVREWLTHRDAIECVSGWNLYYRDHARRLAADRSHVAAPLTTEPNRMPPELVRKSRTRLRLASSR